jgi:hypothetical protein
VAVLGLLGAWNSFHRVEAAVAPSFGGLAWTVPLRVDAVDAEALSIDAFHTLARAIIVPTFQVS